MMSLWQKRLLTDIESSCEEQWRAMIVQVIPKDSKKRTIKNEGRVDNNL